MKNETYDESYKVQLVKYCKESGKSVASVALEHNIKENTLYNWMNKYGNQTEVIAPQVFKTEHQQLKAMQKQIRELQAEN